jgi:CTP synthase
MRLGSYPCVLEAGSLAGRAYGQPIVLERHRHRYEFNNSYRELLAQHGMKFTGLSPDGRLVEIVEIADHPFYLGTQFHPEFKSRPNRPHPLFANFIDAALTYARATGRAETSAPMLQETHR